MDNLPRPRHHQILAGDPKQLGAISRCPVVKEMGLTKSLQEHLMESRSIYFAQMMSTYVGATDRRCITSLTKNYR